MTQETNISTAKFYAAAVLITLLGLVLRLIGARGDLGYDEVWTLNLLAPLTSPDQVFWKVNHDNNHFLNSLWLYYVGPDAPVLLQRAMAIVIGTLTPIAAGWWAIKRDRRTALLTMALFAFALPMVTYGSEARGYAGLILFTLLAARLVEDALDGKPRSWWLGLVALLGTLNHLNMVCSLLALAAWTMWAVAERANFRQATIFTARLFLPATLVLIPVAACVLPAVVQHRFTVGIVSPFQLSVAPLSWGALLRYSVRLGPVMLPPVYIVLAGLALWAGYEYRAVRHNRLRFYAIAIFAFPIVLFACRLPNLDQPRYYLLSGIALMLLLCELAAYPWQDQKLQFAAWMLALLVGWGEITFTYGFLLDQRGHYRDTVAIMTAGGPATYGTDAGRNMMLVDFYAARLKANAAYIPITDWCAKKPDWFLTYNFGHALPPAEQTSGPAGCEVTFHQPQSFGYFGMDGFQWNLYRRK